MLIFTIPKDKRKSSIVKEMFLLVYVNNCSHVSDDVVIKEKEKYGPNYWGGKKHARWRKSHLSLEFTYLFLPQHKSCKICVDCTPRRWNCHSFEIYQRVSLNRPSTLLIASRRFRNNLESMADAALHSSYKTRALQGLNAPYG